MKLIFLDIDGVLNTIDSLSEQIEIVPELVRRVNKLCELTGAKIVISSTWRLIYRTRMIKLILEKAGLRSGTIVGRTPNYAVNKRGSEIQSFLDNLTILEGRQVDAYVIIDDDNDFDDNQKSEHFVQTNELFGFTEEKLKLALEILNRESNGTLAKVEE